MDGEIVKDAVLSAGIIALSFVLGWIAEKIIVVRLQAFMEKTRWQGEKTILNAFNKHIVLWFVLAGIGAAVENLPIKPANVETVDKVLTFVFVLSLTIVVSNILIGTIEHSVKSSTAAFPSTSIFINLTRVVVFLIGGLIVLDALHISITPLLTALGVGGLAVGLALQGTLSNFFAGIQVIASRQIKQGDYIKLSTGEEGYVMDITWRNATIRAAMSNYVFIVPNANLASTTLTNYNVPQKELALLVQVGGVDYNNDLAKVERVTIEVARDVMKTVQGGIPEFEPVIRFGAFGESQAGIAKINFTVILRGKEYSAQYLIKHEFIKRLFKRYKEEGITII